MSGHSKWAQIKRAKGANDAARGRVFTKFGKEILVAVKAGGPDPSANAKLRDVVARARSNNMPNDNIQRMIKKAAGDSGNAHYEAITYEGYGVSGVAVIVEALTDNKNRTAGEVRAAFDKYGGNLGTSGSVQFMFDRLGVTTIPESQATEDKLLEILIDEPVKDIQNEGDFFSVTCKPEHLNSICSALEKANIKIERTGVEWVANNYITVPDEKQTSLSKMLDVLEELDDVQEVFHNGE